MEHVKVLEGEQSLLLASLISLGLELRWVETATGLPCGVQHHRYASHAHWIGIEDLDRLREAVEERAESDPELWQDHAERCTAAAGRLTAAARSLAELAGGDPSRAELAAGFTAFADATKEAAPFLVVTPVVRAALTSRVERGIDAEAPGDAARERAAQGLRQLLARAGEPDAAQESRDFYGLVLEVMRDDEAATLLRSTSPAIAAERMRNDFPTLYGLMREHARAHGWLRARGHGSAPQPPKELVERMQAVVLRWPPETVREAAQPEPVPDLQAALGFPPSPSLARLAGSLRAIVALPCSRVGVHRRAAAVAAPFFEKVAQAVKPEPPDAEHVLFASASEIEAALDERAPFPTAATERRVHGSFTVERVSGDLRVGDPQQPEDGQGPREAEPLTGMTASRGRATGRVRVILAAPQVHALGVGEVLVTATSTPDAIGGESVFPTRAGPRDGIGHAAAIVTDEGGFLSHAAIVAREQGIPCIVGTERATSELRDGQIVEVDATRAVGRITLLGS